MNQIQRNLRTLKSVTPKHVTCVAVSKFHPAGFVRAAYDAGHRHFGENYVRELVDKASDPLLKDLADIKWHFVGHLQANKVKTLLSVPGLQRIDTIDNKKIADKLEATLANSKDLNVPIPFPVCIQVNTSGEKTKSGVIPPGEVSLGVHITDHCPHLKIVGLMSIGSPDPKQHEADYKKLRDCRMRLAAALEIAPASLFLNMGMSEDYISAICAGSSCIRVGTGIFGPRPASAKPPEDEMEEAHAAS